MIPKRGGACQAILDGKFYFPTAKQRVAHCSHPNLKSVDEDKTLLYRMICKYLISGALEYCPPGFKPTNLVPLGLVPKKDVDEPFRIIADGRQMNEYMLPWKTKMTGMAASARGSHAFLRDFSSAYHNVPLGTPCNRKCTGCRPCRGAMEPRADILRPSATKQSRSQQKEPLQDPAHDGCLWEQTDLQQALRDLRPVVSNDCESAASLPTSLRQARFVGCRPGQNCNLNTCLRIQDEPQKCAPDDFGVLPGPWIRHHEHGVLGTPR